MLQADLPSLYPKTPTPFDAAETRIVQKGAGWLKK